MNAKKTGRAWALALGGALLTLAAWAQTVELSEGEIRKIDQAAGKITLAHGEIKSIDMPPMTMVFTVKNPALFDALKKGDKVRFAVVREDGKLVLTEIVPAR
jgi:Cu(I)/Ag(I) efflux system periplasmic protein CusF